jgi:predicted nucleotidyltransferase
MVADDEIVNAATRLRTRLRHELPIHRIVLFGSRARGEAHADSDIDLIVVSASFRGMSAGQRMYHVRGAWDLPVAVDFLCYTPEEFDDLARRPSIVSVALSEGRDIARA